MLQHANNECRRLWKDESGVVLVFTVVVFLTLFVIACSVYAVGENLRQRIEIQNAADAAAYSAAVVQADTLSRVAALNKAMAWTYVQVCRGHMDYIVNQWLVKVDQVYQQDSRDKEARWRNLKDGTGCDLEQYRGRPRDKWIGDSNHRDQVYLNESKWWTIGQIESAIRSFNNSDVLMTMQQNETAMTNMNNAAQALLAQLPTRITKTVSAIIRANTTNTFNDALAGGGFDNIRFCLIQKTPITDYVKPYDDEALFLHGAGLQSSDMGEGHATWFPEQKPWQGYRDYVQWGGNSKTLVAEWRYHVEGYTRYNLDEDCGEYGVGWQQPTFEEHWGKDKGITAESVRDGLFKTATVKPWRLNSEFFAREGGLVVGVARKMNNPFEFMASGVTFSGTGLFRAFSLGLNQWMWAAAAARAGYKDGTDEGAYNSTVDSSSPAGSSPDGWVALADNLSVTDWDGMLIPLSRAWIQRTPAGQNGASGNWNGKSGASVLSALWTEGTWLNLSGGNGVTGLRTVATDAAPPGMSGLPVEFNGMDDHVWH